MLISRAVDALEIVASAQPGLVHPFKHLILDLLTRFEYWEVREHVCLMLPLLPLTVQERREAFETVRQWLSSKSSIVRTFSLQTMYDLAQADPSLLDEAIEKLEHALAKGTPAMRARARILLGVKRSPGSAG